MEDALSAQRITTGVACENRASPERIEMRFQRAVVDAAHEETR